MGLQIITGDLANNKKRPIIERLVQLSEENPENRIFYIVPEHLKFDMENLMLETIAEIQGTDRAVMMNIQVSSFTRLAWFLKQDLMNSTNQISSMGLNMLLRQILEEEVDNLQVYRGQVTYQGFVDQLLDLFQELIRGNIEGDNLDTFIHDYFHKEAEEGARIDEIERQRLHEIAYLYQAFQKKLNDNDISQFYYLKNLSEYINEKGRLPHVYIVIDHHYYFNAEQMSLVLDLAKVVEEVWITLPIEGNTLVQEFQHPMLETPIYTYKLIKDLSKIRNVPIKEDWLIENQPYALNSQLLNTSKLFKELHNLSIPTSSSPMTQEQVPIEVWEVDTPQGEIQHLSNEIHQLVTKDGYRYRDILVVTRDIERYIPMLEPYFEQNDIPVFIDHTSEMRNHPFILFIDGLLGLRPHHWQYEDLFHVLKSELVIPHFLEDDHEDSQENLLEKNHQVNLLENILLANGYFGYRLTDSRFQWRFPEEDQPYVDHNGHETEETLMDLANRWRVWILQYLYHPIEGIAKEGQGKYFARALYGLIQDLGVPEQFRLKRDQAILQGFIETSRRDEQVWNSFKSLLEEFYQIYESEKLTDTLFSELLMTGLNESTYHIIPATMDQVTFTNMVSPQVGPYKVCFVIGMDEHALPKQVQLPSLLDDSYRQAISKYLLSHQYLMQMNQQQLSQELLLAYQLLLNAEDKLYMSYAKNVQDSQVQMSPYLKELVSSLQIQPYSFIQGQSAQTPSLHRSYYGKYPSQIGRIMETSQQHLTQKDFFSRDFLMELRSLEDYEASHPSSRQGIRQLLLKTVQGQALPDRISPETAIALYGENLHVSVSRIEQYYRDPYSHFLLYGLRLREREVFDLDYAKSGDYFHDFVDEFTRQVVGQDLDIVNLSREQLQDLIQFSQNKVLEDHKFNILSASGQLKTIHQHLDHELNHFIQLMQSQLTYSKMRPVLSEVIFGLNPNVSQMLGYEYPLDSGGILSISGRIDRVDLGRVDGQDYLQVIDYKSGQKDFNLVDLYYGLDLQILTYLTVALKHQPQAQALGAFYQPMIQKYIDVKSLEIENTNQDLTLQNNLLKGFVALEPETLMRIDSSLTEESNKSLIYNAKLKKNGDYYSTSSYYTPEQLDWMMAYVHQLFQGAANKIQSGHIALRPFKEERFTPSLNSDYRVICGFDGTIHYDAYRQKTLKKEEVLQEIQQILEKGGN